MTAQWIITLGILSLAIAYAIWRIVKYFRKSAKNPEASGPCEVFGGNCAQCPDSRKIIQPDCQEKDNLHQ